MFPGYWKFIQRVKSCQAVAVGTRCEKIRSVLGVRRRYAHSFVMFLHVSGPLVGVYFLCDRYRHFYFFIYLHLSSLAHSTLFFSQEKYGDLDSTSYMCIVILYWTTEICKKITRQLGIS